MIIIIILVKKIYSATILPLLVYELDVRVGYFCAFYLCCADFFVGFGLCFYFVECAG